MNLDQRFANSYLSVIFNPTQSLFVLIIGNQGSNTHKAYINYTNTTYTNTTVDLIQCLCVV